MKRNVVKVERKQIEKWQKMWEEVEGARKKFTELKSAQLTRMARSIGVRSISLEHAPALPMGNLPQYSSSITIVFNDNSAICLSPSKVPLHDSVITDDWGPRKHSIDVWKSFRKWRTLAKKAVIQSNRQNEIAREILAGVTKKHSGNARRAKQSREKLDDFFETL